MPKESPKKRLILLDSHAIIHRAYHGMPDFTSSDGTPTGALYGLSTMLLKILADLKPDYIIACYDLPQKTFRHEAYDGYKAGRAKTDPALIVQLQSSRDLFEAFNIPIYDAPGFEADDLLGTIAHQLKKEKNIEIIIASGDMDTLQLVDGKRVQVFTLKKGINDTIMYDEDAVVARFGFTPEFLPDYKGLRGDPSDNIIGIKGIGEKTASVLIQKFGTIEEMYKKIKKDKNAIKDLGLTPRIEALLVEGEEDALFSKTLATIRRDAPVKFVVPDKTFRDDINVEKISELFRKLEFKSLTERIRKIFASSQNISSSEDISNSEFSVQPSIPPQEFRELAIALWLLNSDVNNPTEEDIVHFQNAKSYTDAKVRIFETIRTNNLSYIYEEIELPLFPIIDSMKMTGVLIDAKYLKKLSVEYHKELSALEKSIFRHADREFNINSPKQLGEVLFDEMKLVNEDGKKLRKTAGGARSTRESELDKLRGVHPIVDDIFKHRELQKLLSTYIDSIPELIGADGRLHADFNQAGAATGRFSSTNPNLQNIPIKSELGKNIRHAFIAPKRGVLMSFDYSQIELRVAALMSQDEYFIDVFKQGKDVHAAVASKVFGVKESEVTHEMRRRAKVINFGILYGMGVNALRTNLGTDRAEAQTFHDNYFLQFPTIRAYLDGVVEFAKAHGYTETLFGRRRYFPAIKSKIPFMRAMAERMAVNAPLQGTAADVMKIGMRQAVDELAKAGLSPHARLTMQIHDELIFEVDEGYEEKVSKIVVHAMENVIPKEFLGSKTPVPLEVKAESGPNWGELK